MPELPNTKTLTIGFTPLELEAMIDAVEGIEELTGAMITAKDRSLHKLKKTLKWHKEREAASRGESLSTFYKPIDLKSE